MYILCSFDRGCRAWLTDDQTAKNLRSILIAASTGDDIDEEANEKDKIMETEIPRLQAMRHIEKSSDNARHYYHKRTLSNHNIVVI